jgi:hypothetical protein
MRAGGQSFDGRVIELMPIAGARPARLQSIAISVQNRVRLRGDL